MSSTSKAKATASDTVDQDVAEPDLRAGTTAVQNQIDLNDPGMTGREAVESSLAAQAE
ncbi:hypothetical protein [Sphingomonas sp. LH128]|uniref:hypothetical protein n=1 Tax=Sphingomonas sp. LH128 TaxID=473781 RepID=UPI00030828EF|nr:hypothetical protein [Sphingomonas sp. LH128]